MYQVLAQSCIVMKVPVPTFAQDLAKNGIWCHECTSLEVAMLALHACVKKGAPALGLLLWA